MTIKELSKYHSTKIELLQIEDNIKDLESTIIGSAKITGMPMSSNHSSSPTERLGIKLAILKAKLVEKKEKLLDELSIIEDFLTTVEDSEIRVIIRKRFIESKSWAVVGKEIITDRSTPYYKLQKYLKNRGD